MKKSLILFAAIVMIAGLTTKVMAQSTSKTENTNAGAVLIVAMGLTETAPLHFGSMVLTNALGGTCVLASTLATRSFAGGVATSAANPVATNAAYNVTGTGLETYALTLPATTTVTHTSVAAGVYTMDITDMKARFNGAGADAITSALTSGGTDSFTVGGTLTIAAAQVAGIYAGTFNVSVDYN